MRQQVKPMHVESHTRRNGGCRQSAAICRPLPDARATLTPGWYRPVKTAKDSVLAILLLVLAAPLIFVAVVLVKLTSRGPALYSQTRVGRGGKAAVPWQALAHKWLGDISRTGASTDEPRLAC